MVRLLLGDRFCYVERSFRKNFPSPISLAFQRLPQDLSTIMSKYLFRDNDSDVADWDWKTFSSVGGHWNDQTDGKSSDTSGWQQPPSDWFFIMCRSFCNVILQQCQWFLMSLEVVEGFPFHRFVWIKSVKQSADSWRNCVYRRQEYTRGRSLMPSATSLATRLADLCHRILTVIMPMYVTSTEDPSLWHGVAVSSSLYFYYE